MRIAVIGTGYVGLVTGTCLSDMGNEITCVDNNQAKIAQLLDGKIPIYEPGLAELVQRNVAARRLNFTTDLRSAIEGAQLVYLAVGTPSADDGSADLSALWSVVASLAPLLEPQVVVVIKSTVPVGTNAEAARRFRELTGREVDVASNPEFLKEGAAINDFMYPDRVVVGVRREETGELLRELFAPFCRADRPFLTMSPESAEMTKYVANAMLATKISFINEMANLCERLGGDINAVRQGIGHDRRIGFAFLYPGVGYGGSCFPKDVRALAHLSQQKGVEPRILKAVEAVNNAQKHVMIGKLVARFGDRLRGMRIGLWGLAFKPRTDDVREAPALFLIDELLDRGAVLQVHDPEAIENVQSLYGDRLAYCPMPLDALDGAELLAISTEWNEYREPNFAEMRRRMAGRVIVDGRNLYEPSEVAAEGFEYHSIGRATVLPESP